MPFVEAPRNIIEHFNRGRMDGFDEAGYFVHNGVRVYEEGKSKAVIDRDALTCSERVFGKV